MWQHLDNNQAIFKIWEDKNDEMYDKHLVLVHGYKSEAKPGRSVPSPTAAML